MQKRFVLGETVDRANNPRWVVDAMYTEFSSGPYMGEDGQAWCKASKKWMTAFLKRLGATEINFHKNHYEWSIMAKVGPQWWYFSSSDVRHKIMKSLLVRTCDGPTDWTGHGNQWVRYDDPDFEGALERIITGVWL